MNGPMMTCGHTANGKRSDDKAPVCIVCNCETVKGVEPNLEGRMAKCSYGCKPVPSSTKLAFFKFKGEGSEAATQTCKRCKSYQCAHTEKYSCVFFPHGTFEFDEYYCGCFGWD